MRLSWKRTRAFSSALCCRVLFYLFSWVSRRSSPPCLLTHLVQCGACIVRLFGRRNITAGLTQLHATGCVDACTGYKTHLNLWSTCWTNVVQSNQTLIEPSISGSITHDSFLLSSEAVHPPSFRCIKMQTSPALWASSTEALVGLPNNQSNLSHVWTCLCDLVNGDRRDWLFSPDGRCAKVQPAEG